MNKFKALAASIILTATASVAVAKVSAPKTELEYFPVKSVTLTGGPFKTAQDKGIEYILALDPDRLLAPYLKEAGLKPKAENYTNWENTGLDGHIGGHYLTALSYMYAATGDERIGQRLDYFISELKRCQDAAGNGYLSGVPGGVAMWKDVAAGKIKAGGFDLNGKWVPLYNIHKIYAGLKDAYVQTGNLTAREMLVKLTDWMIDEVSTLTDEQIQDMLRSEHGGLNEIFADVAVITGDNKYLDLARRFSHKAILDPLAAGKNELTGKHANTQIPKVIGYKRIADIEGNQEWENAVEYFWNDVVCNRSVSIGGNSVREHFHSPDDFSSMLESEQGPETCNTYNMLRLTKMLHESDPSARYADYAERAMFNHILSSQNPEHGGFVYFTPMRPGHYRVYSQPQTSFWCCVGSGMENQARYGEYIYAQDNDGSIYVNMFIPSVLTLENGNTIEQKTDFPASETTEFLISPLKPEKFSLMIRVPGWADPSGISLAVNGKAVNPAIADGYMTVTRKWKKGDIVTVRFPMELRLEQLADKSPNYSILYGPIVLAADLGHEGQTGMFADDSRGGHIAEGKKLPLQEMPVIVGRESDILKHLTRVQEKPLAFRMSGVRPEGFDNIELVPFASLRECRYIVYWPVISEEGYAERQRLIAEQQAERQKLDGMTADMIICGEQQPESDHFIEKENSSTGTDRDMHFRRANRKGWFSYRLKTDSPDAGTVRIYYKPARNRTAEIRLGDSLIGELPAGHPDGVVFADFPVSLSETESPAVIRISAGADSPTPDIYEIRMLNIAK